MNLESYAFIKPFVDRYKFKIDPVDDDSGELRMTVEIEEDFYLRFASRSDAADPYFFITFASTNSDKAFGNSMIYMSAWLLSSRIRIYSTEEIVAKKIATIWPHCPRDIVLVNDNDGSRRAL
jgi:hypothetical protein